MVTRIPKHAAVVAPHESHCGATVKRILCQRVDESHALSRRRSTPTGLGAAIK
jgi:hypothetical protein